MFGVLAAEGVDGAVRLCICYVYFQCYEMHVLERIYQSICTGAITPVAAHTRAPDDLLHDQNVL
jgi:hypothetical protein